MLKQNDSLLIPFSSVENNTRGHIIIHIEVVTLLRLHGIMRTLKNLHKKGSLLFVKVYPLAMIIS